MHLPGQFKFKTEAIILTEMVVEHSFIIAFYILIGFSEVGVKSNVKTSFQKSNTSVCNTIYDYCMERP